MRYRIGKVRQKVSKIIGIERGVTFNPSASYPWKEYSGTGSFSQRSLPNIYKPQIEYHDGGVTGGKACQWQSYSDLFFNDSYYSHTVSMVISDTNVKSGSFGQLFPALCLHDDGTGAANGYSINYYEYLGFPIVEVVKISGNTISVLAQATAKIYPGDMISISYSWSGTAAILYVYVNGDNVIIKSDFSGYNISLVSGGVGLWGYGRANHISGAVGSISPEWWANTGITPEWPSSGLLGSLGGTQVVIKKYQPYSDDPTPTMLRLTPKDIQDLKFSWKREGGCEYATIKFRYPENYIELGYLYSYPQADEWRNKQWIGGLVEIYITWQNVDLKNTSSSLLKVWSGRIRGVKYKQLSDEIEIKAVGLAVALEENYIGWEWEDTRIYNILEWSLKNVVRSGRSRGYASWVFYPPTITIPQGTLDKKIDYSAKWIRLRRLLDEIINYAPKGIIWGVKPDNTIYITIDQVGSIINPSGSNTPLYFIIKDTALEWVKENNLDKLVTSVLYKTKDSYIPNVSERKPLIFANNKRLMELIGVRTKVISTPRTSDRGLAAIVAQQKAKEGSTINIKGKVKIVKDLNDHRIFFPLLSPQNAKVIVTDDTSRDLVDGGPSPSASFPFAKHTPFILRRFGDSYGKSIRGKGSSGGYVVIDKGSEPSVNFIIHIGLRFNQSHPNTFYNAYIFGRPDSNNIDTGWGALLWTGSGDLIWFYRDVNSYSRQVATNINVSTSSPNQTIQLTMAYLGNQYTGVWYIYDGTILKNTVTGYGMPNTSSLNWSFFRPIGCSDTNWVGWNGDFDNFYLIDMAAGAGRGYYPHVGDASFLTDFIGEINNRKLPRIYGTGLLIWIPGNEDEWDTYVVKGLYGPEPNWQVKSGTYYRVTGQDSGSTISNINRGVILGSQQRWGGPYIMKIKRVEYNVIPKQSKVIMDMELSSCTEDVVKSIASIEERIENLEGERENDLA